MAKTISELGRSFNHLSEEEFFADVDKGIAEADAGLLEDANSIVMDIASEFGLVEL